jgi:hypothetical protein
MHMYLHSSTFQSMCAVPNMAVFCSSFISCFPCMLLRHFLHDFEMAPLAPTVTGITFLFPFHVLWIIIVIIIIFVVVLTYQAMSM